MNKELNGKEGIWGKKKPGSGQPRRSRSKAAFKARQEELVRERKLGGRTAPGKRLRGKPAGVAGSGGKGQDITGPEEGREPSGRGYRKAAAVFVILAFLACTGGYFYKAMGYRNTYLPHTVINGMDVSGRTVEDVKDMISSGIQNYSLVLKLRGGGNESVPGRDMGLHTEFDGSLEEIMRQQNPYAWPRYLLKGPDYDIRTMIAFDQPSLERELKELDCFNPSLVTLPADAYLSDYVSGQGYSIVPETEGNALDWDMVKEKAAGHVKTLEREMDLEGLGCYREPSIRDGNTSLIAARDSRNRYVNMSVTYTFGSAVQVLDGDTIHQWLVPEGQGVALDRDKIKEYVKNLASRYNTAYKKRPFKTSYGQTVEVSGFYGWRINQGAEVEELAKLLEEGESVTREPVYSQTAASHDGPDYGNTYAEVNLTAQHLFFYKDGRKILESDFVSGNVSRGHTTPPGIFALTYKQRDAVLKGEGYASPVKYWMPFNGGIGFHDASWRSSFGGSIYKSGGSHGCVNMPYGAAKELFENVYPGMPVICYNLPGTESPKPTKAPGTSPAPTPAPAPAPALPPPPPPAEPAPAPAPSEQALPQQTPPDEAQEGQPSQPQISIEQVGGDKTPETPGSSGTSAGYGPAFQGKDTGGEVGPGVY